MWGMLGGCQSSLSCFTWILIIAASSFALGYEISSGVCGVTPLSSRTLGRIVNGAVAEEGKWPWQVLITESGEQSCGGSLISEEWIVTAAHCITGDITAHAFYVGAYNIDASGSNAQKVYAHLFLCHKDYDEKTFKSDLCLIKLTRPITFKDYVVPVCLPAEGTTVADGETVIVTGWGETEGTGSNDQLREANVAVLNTADCKSWYGQVDIKIPEKHFCAGVREGGVDSCKGDSGGPLVHKETGSGKTAYVLRGITSFGLQCALKERPGVYVQVAKYLDWIDEKIKSVASNSCQPIKSKVCGGTVRRSGIIRSPALAPNYAYPSNTNCEWNIIAPDGLWMKFIFICYFLLSPEGRDCDDSVTIDTGSDKKTFCGNELPDPYLVQHHCAKLTFIADNVLQYPGFVVQVEFLARTNTTPPSPTEESIVHYTTTSSACKEEICLKILLYFCSLAVFQVHLNTEEG